MHEAHEEIRASLNSRAHEHQPGVGGRTLAVGSCRLIDKLGVDVAPLRPQAKVFAANAFLIRKLRQQAHPVSYRADTLAWFPRGARLMTYNRTQFQQGMSIREFLSRFGTEPQCTEAFKAARWPAGFRCPRCEAAEHCLVSRGIGKLFQCNVCRHQTSLTAGTLMEHTKLPLATWFLAIYLLSQAKTGLSALALKRQLGVSYPTAWLLHQKINRAMAEQEDGHRLGGVVQLDDAYLGGERTGGKVGRGSENKVPFVAAVSVNDAGYPVYLKLDLVSGFTNDAITKWAKASLLPYAEVLSNGLACFASVVDAGCLHRPMVVGKLKPRDLPRVQVGQHGAWQPEDHAGRRLSCAELPQVRGQLPGRLRLPVQPPL